MSAIPDKKKICISQKNSDGAICYCHNKSTPSAVLSSNNYITSRCYAEVFCMAMPWTIYVHLFCS